MCPVKIIKLGTTRRKGKRESHEILFGGGVKTGMRTKLISERFCRFSVYSTGLKQGIRASKCETVMQFSVHSSFNGDDDSHCAVLGHDAVQPGKLATDVSE